MPIPITNNNTKTILPSEPAYTTKVITSEEYREGVKNNTISTRDYISGNWKHVTIKQYISTPPTSPVPFVPQSSNSSSNETFSNMDFKPIENPLNSFDQVTYHVKFSVLSDIPELEKEIIIAESGTTELNIQNFTIDSYVGPDMFTKNTSVTKIDMDILEFYGFDLMDRIVQSAYNLGVRNYQKTPFKLEVKFMGRDSTTGAAISNVLPGKVWGWKVLISKVNTKINPDGMVQHRLELRPISDLAGTDDFMRVPESYSATGKTCGEILTDLFGKLSADINAKYGGIPMVKYQIGGVNYPSSAQSTVASPLDHVVTNQNIFDTTRNPDNASVSTGIAINDLVDYLLSNSESAVKLANGIGTSSIFPDTEPSKYHSTMCRIEKVIKYGNYIDLFGDYEKIVSYILVPYDTIRLVNNVNQYLKINDPERSALRLSHMNSNGFMKKEYDYIFTGQNTEILEFNIDLSFDYYSAVDIMMGAMTYSAKTQGQAFNETANNITNAANYASYQTQIQTLKGKASLSAQEQTDLANLLQKSNVIKHSVEMAAAKSESDDKKRIANTIKSTKNYPKSSYADDEDYSKALDNIHNLPITLRQTPGIASSIDGVVESNYDTRRAIYASLLDQLYGSMDNNLAVIQLEIKGDPYWLGAPGYRDIFSNGFSVMGPSVQVLGITIPGSTPDGLDYANYAVGENVFVLRYKLPNGIDQETNKPIIKENETYTGFYSVCQVTHKFIDGKFTQTVQGYRVPTAAVSKVLKNGKISASSISPSNKG